MTREQYESSYVKIEEAVESGAMSAKAGMAAVSLLTTEYVGDRMNANLQKKLDEVLHSLQLPTRQPFTKS
jgi:hypothetical protein